MTTRNIVLCGVFTALTALGAFIQLPSGDLPVTLQTFFVFSAGLLLTPRYAFFSQLAYMVIGLIGLPVFSHGGGIGYVLQPSFGFILGFCACAPLISMLVRKPLIMMVVDHEKKARCIVKLASGILVSLFALYALGIVYMFLINNLYIGKTISLWTVTASASGVFILIDIVKFIIAVPLCAAVLKRLPQSFR